MTTNSKDIGKFALSLDNDPRNAAINCLVAGIMLLGYCQSVSSPIDEDAMLDNTFQHLRAFYHTLNTQPKLDA